MSNTPISDNKLGKLMDLYMEITVDDVYDYLRQLAIHKMDSDSKLKAEARLYMEVFEQSRMGIRDILGT